MPTIRLSMSSFRSLLTVLASHWNWNPIFSLSRNCKEWCRLWGMELNPSKTKSIIFSRSCTDVPEHPNIMLENTIIENVEALRLLGVIFDPKLTFQSHISTVTRIVSQKIGILRKCWQTYRDDSIVLKTFYSFILPFFEYCSPVWMSAASSHLQQLQRVFNAAKFITPIGISLDHRRDVAAMCLFYKILSRDTHPMNSRLPGPANGNRRTRRANRMNSRALTSAVTPHSVQFNRTYVPYIIEMWNFLPQVVVDASNVDSFKRLVNRHLLSLWKLICIFSVLFLEIFKSHILMNTSYILVLYFHSLWFIFFYPPPITAG